MMQETQEKIRVTTILGTRPEIIRLSEIIKKFDKYFSHRLFFSSQNRESFVGINFFDELGVRQPNVIMENTTSSTAEFLALLLVQIERELQENRPDAVLILGDTNTSLAAIVVKKLGIPIYHLEAGNRSFDSNVPEEVNRTIVDHIADFNLAYSRKAESNLLSEGIDSRNCIVIGTPLREVIEANRGKIDQSKILSVLSLNAKDYFLVSAHRQENIDDSQRLAELLKTLNKVAEKFSCPVVVTTHPRLKAMLNKTDVETNRLINFVTPLGFSDYCKLQLNARVVLSDSGSISEESALMNFKAITLRDSMERPEALEVGSILMSGLNSSRVIQAIEFLENSSEYVPVPVDYLIDNSSERVLNFIQSTYHVRDFWLGRR
jgi:UDP-N-acetylglucosamine 2-epimerase (non-hydrolysing)